MPPPPPPPPPPQPMLSKWRPLGNGQIISAVARLAGILVFNLTFYRKVHFACIKWRHLSQHQVWQYPFISGMHSLFCKKKNSKKNLPFRLVALVIVVGWSSSTTVIIARWATRHSMPQRLGYTGPYRFRFIADWGRLGQPGLASSPAGANWARPARIVTVCCWLGQTGRASCINLSRSRADWAKPAPPLLRSLGPIGPDRPRFATHWDWLDRTDPNSLRIFTPPHFAPHRSRPALSNPLRSGPWLNLPVCPASLTDPDRPHLAQYRSRTALPNPLRRGPADQSARSGPGSPRWPTPRRNNRRTSWLNNT